MFTMKHAKTYIRSRHLWRTRMTEIGGEFCVIGDDDPCASSVIAVPSDDRSAMQSITVTWKQIRYFPEVVGERIRTLRAVV